MPIGEKSILERSNFMELQKDKRPILIGRSLVDLMADADRAGFKGFRAKQLFAWLYRNKVLDIEEPSNLPDDYRQWIGEYYRWGGAEIREKLLSRDGSRKFLFGLDDGMAVEGIVMPDEERLTLCVSSQVGCPLDCKFCLTGRMGLRRQLRTDEILDQVRLVQRILDEESQSLTNIVFMGMGEPLMNLRNLIPALQMLSSPQAFKISSRRITVSTAGYVPGIQALADVEPQVNLAVSLNAVDDEVRERIMPVNRRWPIPELLKACRNFPLKQRRCVTFEYVLLAGVNDSPRDARKLVRLLHGIRNKVNLIPWNPVPGVPFERPVEDRVAEFQKILADHFISAFIRRSKGEDISGACGQLATEVAGNPAENVLMFEEAEF